MARSRRGHVLALRQTCTVRKGSRKHEALPWPCCFALLAGKQPAQKGNEGPWLCAHDTFYQNSKRRRPHTACGSICMNPQRQSVNGDSACPGLEGGAPERRSVLGSDSRDGWPTCKPFRPLGCVTHAWVTKLLQS